MPFAFGGKVHKNTFLVQTLKKLKIILSDNPSLKLLFNPFFLWFPPFFWRPGLQARGLSDMTAKNMGFILYLKVFCSDLDETVVPDPPAILRAKEQLYNQITLYKSIFSHQLFILSYI